MNACRRRDLFVAVIFLLSFSGIESELAAQSVTDTLRMVNTLISNKKIDPASSLLEYYCRNHPKDLNGFWLYAQTEYWLKHFQHSRQLYEQAINLQPTIAYIQLDYARMLINTGKYHKAQALLYKLRSYDVTHEAAMYELAKSFYWQKNNSKAKKEIEELVKINPKNEVSKNLLIDILISSSVWIKAASGYTTDTQPIQSVSPAFEIGAAPHKFFAPYAGVYTPTYNYSGKTSSAKWFLFGNQFSFGKGPEVKVDVGSVQFPYQRKQEITSHIGLRQKISKRITFDMQAEHKPYFNTLKSLDTTITVNHFSSALELNSETGSLGKIGFDNNHFADGNDVYSLYGYWLSKSVTHSRSQLRLGYSFAFNDSRYNRFVPTQIFSEIIASYNQGNHQINGIYDPYFTPTRQQINSVVLSWLSPLGK